MDSKELAEQCALLMDQRISSQLTHGGVRLEELAWYLQARSQARIALALEKMVAQLNCLERLLNDRL